MRKAWKTVYYFGEGFLIAVIAHVLGGLALAGGAALARFGGHVFGTVAIRLLGH